MSNDLAIKIENLSKSYKLYDKPIDRLKEAINPFKRKYHREFFALNNISFEVKRGKTVGLIGKNGSGKSTLLKVITGVLTQTQGQITVNGKISALLELGAGFNPELSGIDNIYLNGTIMGYSKEEMDNRIKGILEFADIGEFVYQPVKTYSSGMFVRLAFAVAINVDPDILIVDEALSVGDMTFQKKCLEKIDSMKESGTTILFCSHDMHAINELCDEVIWVKDGSIKEAGEPSSVIASYVSMMTEVRSSHQLMVGTKTNPNYFIRNSDEVEIQSVRVFDINGNSKNIFLTGEDLVFRVTFNAPHGINDPNYSVIIFRNDKTPVGICKTNFDKKLAARGYVRGVVEFEVILRNIQLNRGKYTFGISVWDKAKKISFANNITTEFEIKSTKIVFGPTEEKCAYFPEVEWSY